MIVVTGPTGNVGHPLLENLVTHDAKVRVVTRHPENIPAPLRARVDVVQGSHADREVVMRALEGAESVFWLVTGNPQAPSAEAAYVDFSRPGADAIRQHGVKRVVTVSALGRGWPKPAGHVTASLHMDDLLASTGASVRALTCPSLMENVLRQKDRIAKEGIFAQPTPPTLRAPLCSTRDAATMAARFLLDTSWSGFEELPILGPEDITCPEMAATMAEVLGRPVRFEEMDLATLRAGMRARGTTEGMAQAMEEMVQAKNEGMDRMVKRTPELTCGMTFRAWCETVLRPACRAA